MKRTSAFWSTSPSNAIIFSVLLLIALLALINLAKAWMKWPGESVDNTLFIAILVVSLLPVGFSIIQVLMDKGATLSYGDFKLDFSSVQQKAIPEIDMPLNIGVPGQAVSDSMTTSILQALKQASEQSVVIINLEDGKAWWETRLLVLLHGAVRLGKPDKFVFVANRGSQAKAFLGWALAEDLYPILLATDPAYQRAHHIARAVASQWKLVEPVPPSPFPTQAPLIPAALPWMLPATVGKSYWAFDPQTGLPNELLEELIMQDELGRHVERNSDGREISSGRLDRLFGNMLNTAHMETNSNQTAQLQTFVENNAPFIALTENGKYVSLLPREAIYNEALKSILLPDQK